MKKIFLSLLVVFMFLSLTVVLVKAEGESSVTLTDGVQIRTDENNGLRWEAKVENAEEGQMYGFLFAQGELSVEQLNKDTEGVIAKEVEALKEDGTYHATMVKFPTSAVVQDISVRAYVKTGEEYIYSENVVVRNLSEVAVEAYEKGTVTGDFVKAVYDASETTFNLNGGRLSTKYEFEIQNFNSYNNGLSNGTKIGVVPISSGASAMNYTWKRIVVEYNPQLGLWVSTGVGSTTSTKDISGAENSYVIGSHSAATDTTSKSIVESIFDEVSAGATYYFNLGLFNLENIPSASGNWNQQVYADTNPDLLLGASVHLGGGATLPKASKDFYDFVGWYSNEDLSNTIILQQGKDRTLFAKYTPTTYEINYELNGGSCSETLVTSYNVESATFALPTATEMSIANGNFGGWYDNETFSGSSITEIALGSYGNKTLYAKWIMDTPTEVELSEADAAVFAQVTPTIVVGSTFTAGKYSLDDMIYEAGVSAVSSIASALSIAQENDIIYVFSGTYSEDLTISTSNLLIIGPNYNTNGNETRSDEANITALTTVNAANVIINGLKFIDSGAIKVNCNNVTITNIYMSVKSIKMYQNNRKGCIVNGTDHSTNYLSNLVISNSYINDTSSSSGAAEAGLLAFDYVKDLRIENNYFTNTNRTVQGGTEGMMTYNMSGTFNVINNTFDYTTDGYLFRLGYYLNSCTEINFIDNVFTGGPKDHTASIYILRGTSNLTINIIGNTFDEFYGTTFAYTNGSNFKANIMYNYFTTTCAFKSATIPTGATVTYLNNYYAAAQTTTTSDYGVITSKDALDAAYAEYLSTLE